MRLNMAQRRSLRRYPARLGSLARAAARCTLLVFLLPLVLQVEAQKIKIQYEKTTEFSRFKKMERAPSSSRTVQTSIQLKSLPLQGNDGCSCSAC